MDIEQLDLKIETIIKQRNIFFRLVVILSISLLLTIIIIFSQSTKTIIIPSNFTNNDKYQITDNNITGKSYDKNYIGDKFENYDLCKEHIAGKNNRIEFLLGFTREEITEYSERCENR